MDETQPLIVTVSLDRVRREALREEIRDAAGDCRDINLALSERAQARQGVAPNREFVLRKVAQLQQLVAALDAVGWTEPPDAPDELAITVNAELATWAREDAAELELSLPEWVTEDVDLDGTLDALSALWLIAGAVS